MKNRAHNMCWFVNYIRPYVVSSTCPPYKEACEIRVNYCNITQSSLTLLVHFGLLSNNTPL